MDPINVTLRVGRLPAASAPTGGELSAEEVDGNFSALKTACEQLDTEKLATSAAPTITANKAAPADGDQLIMLDSEAAGAPVLVTKAQLLAAVTSDIEAILASI